MGNLKMATMKSCDEILTVLCTKEFENHCCTMSRIAALHRAAEIFILGPFEFKPETQTIFAEMKYKEARSFEYLDVFKSEGNTTSISRSIQNCL